MACLARDAREQHPGAAVVKRTRNSIHLALDETTRIAYIGSNTDYHLPDEQTEIDTAWITEEVDGFQWGMTLAEYHARARSVFNAGALVRFTHPASGHWVIFDPQSLNWRDVNNSQAQIAIKQNVTATVGTGIDDDLLTWSAGYGPGRHLTYRCVPQRLEKNIVIDAATDLPAPPEYMVAPIWFEAEFALDHSAGLDLYLDGVLWTKVNNERITTANAIEFREGAVTLFRMARPFARDSAGGEADCQYEVRAQGGIYFVTVRVPQAWLAAAVYPVFIDPTVEIEGGGSTAHVSGESASSYTTARSTATSSGNNSSSALLGQDWYLGLFTVNRAFLSFDTSSLGTAEVTQVNLSLAIAIDYSSTDFDVQIVKQDWSAQNPVTTENQETIYDNCLTASLDDSIWRNTSGIATDTPYTSGNLSTSWVNKTGRTYYSLRSNRDASATQPTNEETVEVHLNSGDVHQPTLIVAYNLPTQRSYPDADVNDGTWTPSTGADLYAAIDETPYSDTDYIQSASNPNYSVCIIGLSNVTDPADHTNHIVYYRYRKDTIGQTINLVVRLKQGTTTIASNTHNGITTTWTDGSFTLSEAEAANITDYTDLRLEFEADVP